MNLFQHAGTREFFRKRWDEARDRGFLKPFLHHFGAQLVVRSAIPMRERHDAFNELLGVICTTRKRTRFDHAFQRVFDRTKELGAKLTARDALQSCIEAFQAAENGEPIPTFPAPRARPLPYALKLILASLPAAKLVKVDLSVPLQLTLVNHGLTLGTENDRFKMTFAMRALARNSDPRDVAKQTNAVFGHSGDIAGIIEAAIGASIPTALERVSSRRRRPAANAELVSLS